MTVSAASAANSVYYSQHALSSGECGASPSVKANYRSIIYYFSRSMADIHTYPTGVPHKSIQQNRYVRYNINC
jgi:hypothetical protein